MRFNYIDNVDCIEGMKEIPDGSVDMVLCDLPYGRTQNRWDEVISFDLLWTEYERVVKPNGAILLFADGMFMANLMRSNPAMWRYNLVWDKVLPSGFLNANRMQLRRHEEICVFYKKPPTYNPQKTFGAKSHSKGSKKDQTHNNYGAYGFVDNSEANGNKKFPTSIITVQKPHPSKGLHPTQKPVALLEYLIKTYTNLGQIVLDNCIGSGSTAVACIRTGRKYIGFELDPKYHAIAQQRAMDALSESCPKRELDGSAVNA